jgi:dsDNA-specific endonuclease/ATPase MutS2
MKLLGWERITAALANHTCSPYTHDYCLQLKPETEFETAQKRLDETAEMMALLDSLESFPMDRFENIHPIFKDVDEQSSKPMPHHYEVATTLQKSLQRPC